MSLPTAWLTLQVVTAALWNDGHQTDDEGPRGWGGVRTGVCARAEGRVGPRNLMVGDAHTHSEGWIQRNLVEKQACPLCADSQGVPQGESHNAEETSYGTVCRICFCFGSNSA